MKIAYLGNFKCSWCTEVHVALTLEKLGHEVVRLQEDAVFLDEIVAHANSSDIFLWTRTYNMLKSDGLEILRQITVPTVSFHLDYYFGISRQMGLETDPFWRTDYVFQPDGDHQEQFKNLGINSFWLPPAIFEDECYSENRDKIRDIIFVGSHNDYHGEYPFRRDLINWLFNSYPQFELFPKDQAVRGAELNELYQSTKIVVGDSLHLDGNTTYTSDRIFETTGRGGFILYPRIKFLEEIFPKEIFYTGLDELHQKIEYYLTNEGEREKLRKECFEITKKNHTYTQRLKHLLKVVQNG